MPRVVQVPSSDSSNDSDGPGIPTYQYRSDSSDSDTDRNRNYNQRKPSGGTVSLSSYLNYTVNYSLYNVTYFETEDDPYCLTCIVDGKEKLFKKDTRVWLHKSSDRKRKFDERNGPANSDATPNKNNKFENHDLESLREQIRKLDSENFINTHKLAVESDLIKSDISSLADSEAELAYSEGSSSGAEQNVACSDSANVDVNKCTPVTKTVRFDQTVDISNDYRSTVPSSSEEDCINTVGSRSTVSYRSLLSEDDSFHSNRFGDAVDHYNESKNNLRSGLLASDMSRIAPAISIETESLNEGLLDYAVNLHNRSNDVTSSSGSGIKSALCKDVGYRILQASHTAMMKMKNKTNRGRVEKKVPARAYNLRSMKKKSGRTSTKQRKGKKGRTGSRLAEQNNSPEVDDSSSVKDFIESFTDASNMNCSSKSAEKDENHNSIRSVPTLFVLASTRWYALLKSNFALSK